MGAKPLQALPGARQCAHPSRPSPLRRLAQSEVDCVVELLVAEHNSHPCCLLPRTTEGLWGVKVRRDGEGRGWGRGCSNAMHTTTAAWPVPAKPSAAPEPEGQVG